jgi:hypothetical protein
MKIALLSFHNAANYGAALQAYALEKFLLDNGIDCEYINYVNDTRKHMYSMTFMVMNSLRKKKIGAAIKYAVGSPFINLRKARFKRFYKKYLKQTKKVYTNSQEASELNDLYDYFIIGSDQVWALENNGADMAFFLDFVKDNRKKISYSSSFGLAEIEDKYREKYATCLSSFHSLAVRETIGQRIVKELTGRDATLVVDPVFLLSKIQWEEIMPARKNNERYIFSYTNTDRQIADFMSTGYSLGERKHYILSSHTRPKDFLNSKIRVKFCMPPQEFLRVIYDADLVVTASFHCLALSILFNKPFVVLLMGDKGKDERLVNLLEQLGLQNRIWTPQMTVDDIDAPIDYKRVNEKINNMRNSSVEYLMKSLS